MALAQLKVPSLLKFAMIQLQDLLAEVENPQTLLNAVEKKGAMQTAFYCPRCRTNFVLPETLSDEIKQEALALIHQKQRLLAMKAIKDAQGCELGDAKAAVFHIPSQSNVCHRCQAPLDAVEIVYCPKCNSLTLNWQS